MDELVSELQLLSDLQPFRAIRNWLLDHLEWHIPGAAAAGEDIARRLGIGVTNRDGCPARKHWPSSVHRAQ